MKVEIRTANGQMTVDLEQFLPTTISRIRKLFILMREGASNETLERVSSYLLEKKTVAEESRMDLEEEQADLERHLNHLEGEIADLRKGRDQTKKRITAIKADIRKVQQIEGMAPVWRKEFEYICGK